uniref:Core protein VP7 n=1 Tax=Wad Medani virus TaxID=40067 RepID=A0A023PMZ6_9REOV|nr:VP7 protein [Wad Medani virus]
MDAYHARALTVLESLSMASETRSHRDPVTETTISIFAMRFNATSNRPITSAPFTREARRNNFYAALDVAYAALNITTDFVLPDYSQNAQTLAILAREELPYTPGSFRRMLRIRECTEGAANVREEVDPYTQYQIVVQTGCDLDTGAAGCAIFANSPNQLQITIEAGRDVDVTADLFPQNREVIAIEVTVQILSHAFLNGAIMEHERALEMAIDGMPLVLGARVTISVGSRVTIANRGVQNRGILIVTCHRFWVPYPPRIIYDTMEADILAVYTYKDRVWDSLRAYVLAAVGLPERHFPLVPLVNPRQVLAIALLSRLFDVYCATHPELALPMAVPGGALAQRLAAALQVFRDAR